MATYRTIPVAPDVHKQFVAVCQSQGRTQGGQIEFWLRQEGCDHDKQKVEIRYPAKGNGKGYRSGEALWCPTCRRLTAVD